jgi:DNA-directed RNA polymerase specialized sigma54-like protein
MDENFKEVVDSFYNKKYNMYPEEFFQKEAAFLKENKLAKINVAQESMKDLVKMIRESIPYALKFFKSPKSFYMTGDCIIYMGYYIDREWGKMYILSKKIKRNKYFTMYFNIVSKTIPCDLADESQIKERIDKFDWLLIDKQVFSLWLEEQSDYLSKEYESYLKMI